MWSCIPAMVPPPGHSSSPECPGMKPTGISARNIRDASMMAASQLSRLRPDLSKLLPPTLFYRPHPTSAMGESL